MSDDDLFLRVRNVLLIYENKTLSPMLTGDAIYTEEKVRSAFYDLSMASVENAYAQRRLEQLDAATRMLINTVRNYKEPKQRSAYRDAMTGRFVSKNTADRSPETTVKQRF